MYIGNANQLFPKAAPWKTNNFLREYLYINTPAGEESGVLRLVQKYNNTSIMQQNRIKSARVGKVSRGPNIETKILKRFTCVLYIAVPPSLSVSEISTRAMFPSVRAASEGRRLEHTP